MNPSRLFIDKRRLDKPEMTMLFTNRRGFIATGPWSILVLKEFENQHS